MGTCAVSMMAYSAKCQSLIEEELSKGRVVECTVTAKRTEEETVSNEDSVGIRDKDRNFIVVDYTFEALQTDGTIVTYEVSERLLDSNISDEMTEFPCLRQARYVEGNPKMCRLEGNAAPLPTQVGYVVAIIMATICICTVLFNIKSFFSFPGLLAASPFALCCGWQIYSTMKTPSDDYLMRLFQETVHGQLKHQPLLKDDRGSYTPLANRNPGCCAAT